MSNIFILHIKTQLLNYRHILIQAQTEVRACQLFTFCGACVARAWNFHITCTNAAARLARLRDLIQFGLNHQNKGYYQLSYRVQLKYCLFLWSLRHMRATLKCAHFTISLRRDILHCYLDLLHVTPKCAHPRIGARIQTDQGEWGARTSGKWRTIQFGRSGTLLECAQPNAHPCWWTFNGTCHTRLFWAARSLVWPARLPRQI